MPSRPSRRSSLWTTASILSPRSVKEKGKAYGRSPVGTGPFKFVEWKEGDYISLERFPNYWETDAAGGKLPYLDKVIFKFIIEPSTLVAALKTTLACPMTSSADRRASIVGLDGGDN